MPRAERGDADADEEPGVVAVQTALLHHVVSDIAGGPAAVERIADLMAGNDRRLAGSEVDLLGLQRIQETCVYRVGVRARCGDRHNTEWQHQD
jgi:hypothetical protein